MTRKLLVPATVFTQKQRKLFLHQTNVKETLGGKNKIAFWLIQNVLLHYTCDSGIFGISEHHTQRYINSWFPPPDPLYPVFSVPLLGTPSMHLGQHLWSPLNPFFLLHPRSNYQQILQALLAKVILNLTTFYHHLIWATIVPPLNYCTSPLTGLPVSNQVSLQSTLNEAAQVTLINHVRSAHNPSMPSLST